MKGCSYEMRGCSFEIETCSFLMKMSKIFLREKHDRKKGVFVCCQKCKEWFHQLCASSYWPKSYGLFVIENIIAYYALK